jgi:hypothetical protein
MYIVETIARVFSILKEHLQEFLSSSKLISFVARNMKRLIPLILMFSTKQIIL